VVLKRGDLFQKTLTKLHNANTEPKILRCFKSKLKEME